MRKFKKQIINSSDSNTDPELSELFLECQNRLKVRGRITLRTSKYIKTPFVFGLLKPLKTVSEVYYINNKKLNKN